MPGAAFLCGRVGPRVRLKKCSVLLKKIILGTDEETKTRNQFSIENVYDYINTGAISFCMNMLYTSDKSYLEDL